MAETLLAKQELHGDPRHRVAPVYGPDGRAALCADLVTEIGPGGLYHPLFATLDSATFAQVEIHTRAALEAAGWFAAPPETDL